MSGRRRLAWNLGWILVLLPLLGAAAASDRPVVRLTLEQERISVGESAALRLTLLVPTWQPKPPVYPSFEVPNGITRLPADSSYPTTERIDGETWSGIVRRYEFFPLLAADYRLGGGTIRVSWANPGAEAFVADVSVPEVTLEARVPEGATHLDPFLAGTELRFTRTVAGTTAGLQVGDALVVEYEATLQGMPALFLPPLAPEIQAPELKSYADEPVSTDGPPAVRRERITLIPEKSGVFELPAQRLTWWNTTREEVVVTEVPAVSFSVIGPGTEDLQPPTSSQRTPWLWAAVVMLLLLLGRLWSPRFHRTIARRRAQKAAARAAYEASEAWAFSELTASIDGREPDRIYGAALRWLERLHQGMDLRTFAALTGTPRLENSVAALSASLYGTGLPEGSAGGTTPAWEAATLREDLISARDAFLAAREMPDRKALPPLNP